MRRIATVLQDETARGVLDRLQGLLQETAVVVRRLFVLATDNLLITAVLVAVIGILLLRPPHAPR